MLSADFAELDGPSCQCSFKQPVCLVFTGRSQYPVSLYQETVKVRELIPNYPCLFFVSGIRNLDWLSPGILESGKAGRDYSAGENCWSERMFFSNLRARYLLHSCSAELLAFQSVSIS